MPRIQKFNIDVTFKITQIVFHYLKCFVYGVVKTSTWVPMARSWALLSK